MRAAVPAGSLDFGGSLDAAGPRGCGSMAERKLPKLETGVRFPSPALFPCDSSLRGRLETPRSFSTNRVPNRSADKNGNWIVRGNITVLLLFLAAVEASGENSACVFRTHLRNIPGLNRTASVAFQF